MRQFGYCAAILLAFLCHAEAASPDSDASPIHVIATLKSDSNELSLAGHKLAPSASATAAAACGKDVYCEIEGNADDDGMITQVTRASRVGEFDTPAKLLDFIYAHYTGENAGGFAIDDSEDFGKIYSPSLASLQRETRAIAVRDDEEDIGESPWMNAQEWDVRDLAIEIKNQGPARALGLVTFRNKLKEDAGQETYTFDLIRTEKGWRIDDVRDATAAEAAAHHDGPRLSETLKAEILVDHPTSDGAKGPP